MRWHAGGLQEEFVSFYADCPAQALCPGGVEGYFGPAFAVECGQGFVQHVFCAAVVLCLERAECQGEQQEGDDFLHSVMGLARAGRFLVEGLLAESLA